MNGIEFKTMPVADFGAPNPMPDIGNVSYIHAGFEVSPKLNEEEKRYLGKGMINTVLPYMIEDGYDRNKKPRPVKIAVLENEFLRAEFLPDYGGRLWALYDKRTGKNALYTNSVLQPCNFAILNAWFSGGVEFNIGIKGHTPLTCSPMFCELIGEDGLRFYEYERIRGVAYSITAFLPKGSETLYVRPRIENANDHEVYMYWWSNIAFPETENTRVIVPAKQAVHCLYSENHYLVDKAQIPFDNGVDATYSMNLAASSDYFYQIPKDENKWIAAVDKNGDGLFHYSDKKLRARKLFLWGHKTGGRHWNEFLSEKGQAYIEIQAGLATTQLEHLPMPAGEVWTWTEGYTPICGADDKFYGDYDAAIKRVEEIFDDKVARKAATDFDELTALKVCGDEKVVSYGSGFGSLENELRKTFGKKPISETLDFTVPQDEKTAQWKTLLEKGYLPCPDENEKPLSYAVGKEWSALIEKSFSLPEGNHWYAYNMLGVSKYAEGYIARAKDAFTKSVEMKKTLWNTRNLAMIYLNALKDEKTGLKLLDDAFETEAAKTDFSFLKEYAKALTDFNVTGKWTKIYYSLNEELKNTGRLKVYLAKDLLASGDPEAAAKILTPDFILSDVKEGELALSALWKGIYLKIIEKNDGLTGKAAEELYEKKYPLPYSLDFRMHD